jgi:hypothetical protein
MNRKHRSSAAAILGAAIIVAASAVASADAKPTPPPAPYAPAWEIIKESKTPQVLPEGVQPPTKIVLTCPSGKTAVGGGFDSGSNHDGTNGDDNWNSPIRRSYPSAANAWTVEFDPDRGDPIADVTAYAVCANTQ